MDIIVDNISVDYLKSLPINVLYFLITACKVAIYKNRGNKHTRNYIEFLNMYAEREPRCNLVKTFDFESISKKGCVRIYDTPEDKETKIRLQKFNEKYNKASKYVPF